MLVCCPGSHVTENLEIKFMHKMWYGIWLAFQVAYQYYMLGTTTKLWT